MKKITRKEFIKTTGSGLAAVTIMPGILSATGIQGSGKRALGSTGIEVTPLCFGASRTMDEGLIASALESGINFLDTGRAYANGNNERLVGRVTSHRRGSVVIQSKMYLEESELTFKGKGRRGSDEIRDILGRRLEESLRALDTDYIDVMLYHSAELEYLVYHDTVLRFYDDQKRSGAIRAHGFSSHDYTLGLLIRNNREKFWDVIMHPFNFSGSFVHSLSKWSASWDQEMLINELDLASQSGTGIVAMKTCSAGPMPTGDGEAGSYRKAVDWVVSHPFISSAAVAISSYDQLGEYLS